MVLLPPQSTAKEEAACKLKISSLYLGICNYGSDITVVDEKSAKSRRITLWRSEKTRGISLKTIQPWQNTTNG
jgi:hypothetical protein